MLGDDFGGCGLAGAILGGFEAALELGEARLDILQARPLESGARLIEDALRLLRIAVRLIQRGAGHTVDLTLGAVGVLGGAQAGVEPRDAAPASLARAPPTPSTHAAVSRGGGGACGRGVSSSRRAAGAAGRRTTPISASERLARRTVPLMSPRR